MSPGDDQVDTRERLLAQRRQLMRARDEIDALVGQIDQQLHDLSTARASSSSSPVSQIAHPTSSRPLRAMVLDALDDLGWLAYSRELAMYLQARYGRDVAPTRFSSLTKDEVRAFESKRPRSVYLCHGLVHERGEAIKRLWGRSDWPLAQRVVAPTTGRVQHLKLTARLCELALTVGDTAADPDMLRFIAADHARDVPGVKVRKGEFPLEDWRTVALDVLAELEPRDEQLRESAAERLASLPEVQQLFGVEEGPLFPLPGSRQAAGGRSGA